jgi:hypothetical protein
MPAGNGHDGSIGTGREIVAETMAWSLIPAVMITTSTHHAIRCRRSGMPPPFFHKTSGEAPGFQAGSRGRIFVCWTGRHTRRMMLASTPCLRRQITGGKRATSLPGEFRPSTRLTAW